MAALTYKTLGQSNPAAGVLTSLYTVPAATSAILSSVFVCNTTGSTIKFRLSVAIAGAADTLAQYLYFDTVLGKNQTYVATVGATLAATDVLRCQADNPLVAFTAFGVENT